MPEKYYFDTSIWLDLFEERDESNLPKGKFVVKLIKKIIEENNKIIYSEVVKNEMLELRYNRYEIDSLFFPLRELLIYVYSNKKQFGKAKNLSEKRNVPLFDALHALLARDQKSILVTRDRHFDKLLDIIKYKKPEQLI